MVQYRYIQGSGGNRSHGDGFANPELRMSLLRGVDSFVSIMSPEMDNLTLPHRAIRDNSATAGASLLDFVWAWMRRAQFIEGAPTYEEFLLTVIAILDNSVLHDARQNGYVHSVLARRTYEMFRKAENRTDVNIH